MDDIVLAIVGALQAVTVAGIGAYATIASRTAKHTREIRDQVSNDHSTNLRDELDERHSEVKISIGALATDMIRLRGDTRDNRDAIRAISYRMSNLETAHESGPSR